jgi:hypothetical protein
VEARVEAAAIEQVVAVAVVVLSLKPVKASLWVLRITLSLGQAAPLIQMDQIAHLMEKPLLVVVTVVIPPAALTLMLGLEVLVAVDNIILLPLMGLEQPGKDQMGVKDMTPETLL